MTITTHTASIEKGIMWKPAIPKSSEKMYPMNGERYCVINVDHSDSWKPKHKHCIRIKLGNVLAYEELVDITANDIYRIQSFNIF